AGMGAGAAGWLADRTVVDRGRGSVDSRPGLGRTGTSQSVIHDGLADRHGALCRMDSPPGLGRRRDAAGRTGAGFHGSLIALGKIMWGAAGRQSAGRTSTGG